MYNRLGFALARCKRAQVIRKNNRKEDYSDLRLKKRVQRAGKFCYAASKILDGNILKVEKSELSEKIKDEVKKWQAYCEEEKCEKALEKGENLIEETLSDKVKKNKIGKKVDNLNLK